MKHTPKRGCMNEYECGCWIGYDGGGVYYMNWCKMHKTAPELLEACKSIWKYIEDGTLIRDITKDGEEGWAIKMLNFVNDLNKVQQAILKAEEGRE